MSFLKNTENHFLYPNIFIFAFRSHTLDSASHLASLNRDVMNDLVTVRVETEIFVLNPSFRNCQSFIMCCFVFSCCAHHRQRPKIRFYLILSYILQIQEKHIENLAKFDIFTEFHNIFARNSRCLEFSLIWRFVWLGNLTAFTSNYV